ALITDGINYSELGYLAGLQAVKILKGEAKPADMPIEYIADNKLELAINDKTMKELGIKIPKDIMEKAKIVK
ncbi:MAG: ABC transporter substrate binding protein, partial [Erysipelotrichales bacterium]